MQKKNKAFTLLELIIVITIIGIVSMMIFTPYNYFQKKAELKLALKNISKTLSEARNNSIFWVLSWTTNQSVWVYFENNKNKIKIYNYPYNFWTWSQITLDNIFLKKEINIWPNIKIDKIEENKKVLFLYSAISGKLNIFSFDSWKKQKLIDKNNDNIIQIWVWYKTTKSWGLYKILKYYTKTYITDY